MNFLDFLAPSPFIPPQNVEYFLMLPSLVHKIFTFYVNTALKMSRAKGLNGLVRFAERRNLVPSHVPSHFKRSLTHKGRQFTNRYSRIQLKCDGTRWLTEWEEKRKLSNAVGSQYPSHYLRTRCIQHYYHWCAHLGCQQSTELTSHRAI